MAFGRSFPEGTDARNKDSLAKRMPRTEKIPQEIADKIKANPGLKDQYFHMWLESKCSWGVVTIVEQMVEKEIVHNRSKRRWLMRPQMIEHYLCEVTVDHMISQ